MGMDDSRVNDEFKYMKAIADLAKSREYIAQYGVGLAFHRQRVEDAL
jgi:hypothetical protein